ncbi:MAG TPA: DUF3379 family protein [Steroidobacteraceae bacterium]
MSNEFSCRHARLEIGGDPHGQSPELEAHLATCAACTRFRTETLALDARLRAAFELPLAQFRKPPAKAAPPARRFALAASVVLALLVGGGAWLFRPSSALAAEIVEHVEHEPGSWQGHDPVSPEVLAAVLARAGVRYDSRLPVTYASPCPFRGHIVPHLVVQTDRGPLTVMVLDHVKSDAEGKFSEGEYRGIVMPAGSGSIAVVARKGQEFDGALKDVLEGVR